MNFFLDMKTIFILLVVGHLFTVILISAYWRYHQKDTTINTFFLSKCFQAIAWFFLTLRGGVPDVLSISLANSFLFLGASLETIAILKLQRAFDTTMKKIYSWLTIFNIVGFHLVIFFDNVESLRIVFASVGTAAFIVIPAYRLIRGETSSFLMKVMGYLYAFVAISLIGRAITALLSSHSMGLFTPGIYQTFSFLALYLVMILGNTGFVLLLKEDVDRELLRMATYDDLTGALNRRAFISRARQCLSLYAKKQKPVSLLLFDVDHFKKINDTYGHTCGDGVLQDLTKRMHHHLGAEDLFGRYGGDEFAILVPGLDETQSNEFAEQIRQLVQGAVLQDVPLRYTLSIGLLTVVPTEQTQLETLYNLCDHALYTSKRNGRNQVYRIQQTP